MDQGGTQALADHLIALVDQPVREGDDACVRAGFAGLQFGHFRFRAQRVADEDGLGHHDLVIAQIGDEGAERGVRSEEHTSELQSLMRISYAVFCLKKKNKKLRYSTQYNYL